ncbi:MAG: SRPBCC domain-containing protein [Candidatus Poribacteria bacterium]
MPELPNVGKHLARNTMSWSRHIDAPVERVWEVVTRKEHLDEWFMPTQQTELRLGGRHWWFDGGVVDEFEAGRVIRFYEEANGSWTRFAVAPDGDGALFTLTERMGDGVYWDDTEWEETEDGWVQLHDDRIAVRSPGGRGTHWVGVAAGYHGFVDSLDTYITGKPDGYVDYDALNVLYDEWYAVLWGEGGEGWNLKDAD